MPAALIGLGSNLGDRAALLERSVELLRGTNGVSMVRASAWHITVAIGGPSGQPSFLNGAALVETSLSPEAIWSRMQEIELSLGRVRREPWAARTIDLDLLLYDNVVQRAPGLALPHPRMAFRRFVLQPAAEVAPEMRHPTIGWTVAQLLHHVLAAPPYVAISGSLHQATHWLAHAVAESTGWKLLQFSQEIEASAPVGSPSLGLRQTIEFLREQAALLARKSWTADGNIGAISPFWMEDLLAIGDVLWPGGMEEPWQTLAPSVVPPKLLVVYEASARQFHEMQNSEQAPPRSVAVALWHRLNESRRQRAARPGIGPVLWLESVEQAAAVRELAAAIQAMS
ncbi:MAG TPA: 2-amino-4-hydroxy-6-hydroxymethyldihydropteridine diphosphokinase [Pirellulales bacterium]|nr:2-amino-4-hydroxy-6-hydroxymethyldihydropteridine diphosphokinase [Pirellulales bacterium]